MSQVASRNSPGSCANVDIVEGGANPLSMVEPSIPLARPLVGGKGDTLTMSGRRVVVAHKDWAAGSWIELGQVGLRCALFELGVLGFSIFLFTIKRGGGIGCSLCIVHDKLFMTGGCRERPHSAFNNLILVRSS